MKLAEHTVQQLHLLISQVVVAARGERFQEALSIPGYQVAVDSRSVTAVLAGNKILGKQQ
ncbi:hypothetical protein D3C85_1811040 [compost metagenome]